MFERLFEGQKLASQLPVNNNDHANYSFIHLSDQKFGGY